MRSIASWTVAGVLATSAAAIAQPMTDAQPQQDVRELLQTVNDATRAVDAVSYHATRKGIGALASRVPVIKGDLLVVKNLEDEQFPAKVHADGKVWSGGAPEPTAFITAYDGTTGYRLSHEEEALITAPAGEGAIDLLGEGQGLFMLEYAHPAPFQDEINAAVAELEGQTVVNGVTCNVIYVEYGPEFGTAKARWYFGAEDNLPRKVERLAEIDGRFGANVLTITDLQVNPSHTTADLAIKAPSGYKTVDYERPQRPQLLDVGAQAPAWTLPDPEGETHSLADYRGKIVLMDFWATWCGPCKRAMPSIQALHEQFADRDVVVLGINTWEGEDGDPAGYMRQQDYTYGLLLEGDQVAEEYGVSGIPTFYLIGKDGTIIYRHVGFGEGEKEEIAKVIEKNLSE